MIRIDDDKCSGCQLCSMVCPQDAIIFVERNGFRYPEVQSEKCIECGLCDTKCPMINNNNPSSDFNVEVYASWSKDSEVRNNSTSGGICYELSNYIINNGGYVAGVVWDEDYKDAYYELVNSIDGLKRITQTKYFQPRMNNIYHQIKQKLDDGCDVLYFGTACTNAALQKFLGKAYDNLICCDFICRGYTSQKYHKKRIDYLENKYSSKIKHVQYKNKDYGWSSFGTKFVFENGKSFYINRKDDPYEIMFGMDDYNTRPSCFSCKYRSMKRLTDITLGDFWGIKNCEGLKDDKGISAIIVSTDKGKTMIGKIRDKICLEKKDIYEVKSGNPALLNSYVRKDGATQFFTDLDEMNYKKFNRKYANKTKQLLSEKKRDIIDKIKTILLCSVSSFVYYNFFSKSVKRKKGKYIIPFRGTRIELNKYAEIQLNETLLLNYPKHSRSNEQMYLKLSQNSKLIVNGRSSFAAMNTVEIAQGAILSIGKMDTNYGTTIICSNKISIGDDVGIGRNVLIYDSSFHSTSLNNSLKNKPLMIGNHVWISTGVTIAKGLKIENGAIISINSTVTRNVKAKTMVSGNPAKVVMTEVEW